MSCIVDKVLRHKDLSSVEKVIAEECMWTSSPHQLSSDQDFLDIVRDRNQRGLRLITEREFVEEQK